MCCNQFPEIEWYRVGRRGRRDTRCMYNMYPHAACVRRIEIVYHRAETRESHTSNSWWLVCVYMVAMVARGPGGASWRDEMLVKANEQINKAMSARANRCTTEIDEMCEREREREKKTLTCFSYILPIRGIKGELCWDYLASTYYAQTKKTMEYIYIRALALTNSFESGRGGGKLFGNLILIW